MRHRRDGGSGDSSRPEFDVVFTWAARADARWREARHLEWQRFVAELPEGAAVPVEPRIGPEATLETFRYSLRSVWHHMEGVRKVFVLCDGHLPSWLNAAHPQLEIVTHESVFPGAAHVPSYNSQAIEACLHRIPGLAERFVYLNEDFFLLHRHDASDFFDGSGRLRIRLGRGLAPRGSVVPGEPVDTSANRNTSCALDAAFGRSIRLTVMHRPRALTRAAMASAEARFPVEFDATRRHRFRTADMFAVHNGLVPFTAIHDGTGVAVRPHALEKDIFYWSADPRANEKTVRRIMQGSQAGSCIQDAAESYPQESRDQFHRMVGELYPQPSPFELSTAASHPTS